MQLLPVGGDQIRGIDVRTTAADRDGQLRRQLAVGDRQRNAKVIGFDMPAGLRSGPFDRLAPGPRLGRSQETSQPAIGQRANPLERRGRRTA